MLYLRILHYITIIAHSQRDHNDIRDVEKLIHFSRRIFYEKSPMKNTTFFRPFTTFWFIIRKVGKIKISGGGPL